MQDNKKNPDGVNIVFTESGADENKNAIKKTNIKFRTEPPASDADIKDGTALLKPEFIIPDEFSAEAGSVHGGGEDTPKFINVPYMPRFTEASEKFHDANIDRLKGKGPEISVKKEGEPDNAEEKLDNADELLDPTAEIDAGEENRDAVAVNIKPMRDDTPDSSTTFFKFEDPKEEYAEISENENEEEEELYEEALPEENFLSDDEDGDLLPPEDEANELPVYLPDPMNDTRKVSFHSLSENMNERARAEDAPAGIGDKLDGKPVRGEFKLMSERDKIKDRFLDRILSIRIRFFAALAITALVLVFENLYLFGVDIPIYLGLAAVPGIMCILDMILVVCLYLTAIPEVVHSFKRLFAGVGVSELFVTAEFVVCMAYNIITASISPAEFPLFGLIFAVSVLSAIGASYFKNSADFTSFKTVSCTADKIVVDRKPTHLLEEENRALDGALSAPHRSKTARFFRAMFVSDFFKRSENVSENSKNIWLILASSGGLSLVLAVCGYFIKSGGLTAAAAVFGTVFMLSLPAMSVLLHKLPFFYSAAEAASRDSAVIGEAALSDYAGIDAVTFRDTEVFGPDDVVLHSVMLYGNNENLEKSLRQMSALFMNVGGPLDIMFSDSLHKKVNAASGTYIEESGITGYVDGHKVHAGTMDYMVEQGIRLPLDESKYSRTVSESVRTMYAAEDGEIYAKFYIRYSFSEEFTMLLHSLSEENMTALVYTRDPNINEKLIKALTPGADSVRILKKLDSPSNDMTVYHRVSAALATNGEKLTAVEMLLLAKRYNALETRLAVTELIAGGVGAALGLLLAIGGMLAVPTVALAVWQAGWCGVLHFISSRSFKPHDGSEHQ